MDYAQDGRDAFYHGDSEHSCPHESGTEASELWLTGWWECQYQQWDDDESAEWADDAED